MNDSKPLLSDWQLGIAKPEHDARLRILFSQAFGHAISQEEWDWKYAETKFRGSMLSKNSGELVGFFGGMPRPFIYQGKIYLGVQNGDVMVRARERGIFSRRGAFYQVASHFIEQFIGPDSIYAFGFGFPHHRAFRLAIELGLYEQAGHLKELSWKINNLAKSWGWGWELLEKNELGAEIVEKLWGNMQRSFPDYFLPVRDSHRWNWRYQQRPEGNYQILLLRKRITGKPLAVLALRFHEDYCHWLDYIGPHEHLAMAAQAGCEFAKTQQKPLRALVNDSIVDYFTTADPKQISIKSSGIYIPTNINTSKIDPKPWINKLWLMGGDSDFM